MPLSRLASSATLLLFALAGACSRASSNGRNDEPSPAAVREDALSVIARVPELRARLHGDTLSLDASRGVFARAKAIAPSELVTHARFPEGLEAKVPVHGGEAVHLAVGGDGYWVDVAPVGIAEVEGEAHGAAILYAEARPSTDLVALVDRDSLEEIRLLRDANAPLEARYHLTFGPGVASSRVREGRVELLDGDGYVRLATAPMFAVDAKGVRRTITPRLDGNDLVVALDAAGLEYPIAVDPLWTTKPPMANARVGHILVPLSDGTAIAACGTTTSTAIESYNSATNTWSTIGNLGAARANCWGFVLTTGAKAGQLFIFDTSTSEFFDPVSKTRTAGPAPITPYGTNAVILTDGRVLIGGGTFSSNPASEIYNPVTNAWSNAGTFGKNYNNQIGATAIAGGDALFMGGTGLGAFSPGSDDATSWRWHANAWTATPNMNNIRGAFGVGLLLDGRVLVSGGEAYCAGPCSSNPVSGAEVYSPSANTWTSVASMAVARVNGTQTTLTTGKVLVTGGANGLYTTVAGFAMYSSAELYDPTANTWTTVTAMSVPRRNHVAARLANGTVLVAGGDDGASTPNALSSVELFAQSTNGTACTSAFECTSGFCVSSVCCSTASCPAGYACNTTLKKGVCSRPQGTACGADSECETGHCVDGVCCDTACTGVCQSCAAATKVGTCSPISGKPVAAHGTCPAGTDTCSAETCNGSDGAACHFPTSSTVCGTKACSAGVETHQSTCDGTGSCSDVPVSCGAYVCNTTACFTSCTASTQCAAGFYCDTASSTCVALVGLGKPCSASAPCGSSLTCVDGFCCGTASCPAGSSCGVSGSEGTCIKTTGTACTADVQCGSGHCVDSVCCESACTGQCESCNTAGAPGKCDPVTGAPQGARPACSDGGGDVCAAASCDGTNRTTCAATAGSSVQCRAAGCSNGTLTAQAFCASGACPAAATTSCGGYACADASTCRTSCTVDTDCTSGFTCIRGKCSKQAASCSSDGTSVIDSSGNPTSCAPYLCSGNACLQSCTSTTDCASGASCDTTTSTCVAEGGDGGTSGGGGSGSSGGCAVADEADPCGLGFGAIAIAALGWVVRRRRGGAR